MEFDRETAYQLLFAGGAVVLFIAATVFVAANYGTNGNLTAEGGMMLVATLAAFVLLLVLVGFFLERQEF